MNGWWVLNAWQVNPAYLLAWVFWVIFSITLHELGHGWAALRQGDRTPLYSGHMTWNPLVHMGTNSLLMFALCGIAWGAMPVNPANFRSRYGDAIVSFAGPLVNLLLAALCLAGVYLFVKLQFNGDLRAAWPHAGFTFLYTGLRLSLILFILNLMPIPPLDGSRILGDFVPAFRRIFHGEQGAVLATIGTILVFFVLGRQISQLTSEYTLRLLVAIL